MIKQVYVIDLMVKDLAQAAEDFKKIFGVEPIPMAKKMHPTAEEMDAVHFEMPGNGVGIHCIGLFQLKTETPTYPENKVAQQWLKEHGEGVSLIGILVDNLEEMQKDLESKGIKFLHDKPQRYFVGRNNITMPMHGVQFALAEHDAGAFETWKSRTAEVA